MKYLGIFVVLLLLFIASYAVLAEGVVEQLITIEMQDGLTIHGTFLEVENKKAPAIILMHMMGNTRKNWETMAPKIQALGFNVLSIDLRGHGESINKKDGSLEAAGNFSTHHYAKMVDDLGPIVQWLSKQKHVEPKRIGLAGASLGANVALLYAARPDSKIRAVALLSPGFEYKLLKISKAVEDYKGPLLFMASKLDAYSAETCETLVKTHKGEHVIKIFQGTAHGTFIFAKNEESQTIFLDFIKKYLSH